MPGPPGRSCRSTSPSRFFRFAVILVGIADRARAGSAAGDDAAALGPLADRFANRAIEVIAGDTSNNGGAAMIVLRAVDQLNIAVGKAVSFLIWIGIVVLCTEVVARYVFGQPTLWAHGYTQRIFGSYFRAGRRLHADPQRPCARRPPAERGQPARWRAFLDLINFAFLILWGGDPVLRGILVLRGQLAASTRWTTARCAIRCGR